MFIDSHCHLEMESYDVDRAAVIEHGFRNGLSAIITVGTEEPYFQKVIDIAESHSSIYGAIGIHPHNAKDFNEVLAGKIRQYLRHKKIVGYGEIGLDFFKNHSPRKTQEAAFREQIEIAKEARLPIIVHSRNAPEETLKILREHYKNSHGGIIHCYSYDLSFAKKFLDLGFFISIPGTITYPKNNALQEVVKNIPLDRILSETDAPFLTPQPKRGKRNEPAYVKYTVERIAQILEKPVEGIAQAIVNNFETAFLRS